MPFVLRGQRKLVVIFVEFQRRKPRDISELFHRSVRRSEFFHVVVTEIQLASLEQGKDVLRGALNFVGDNHHIFPVRDDCFNELSKKRERRVCYDNIALVEERKTFRRTEVSISFERRSDEIERIVAKVAAVPFELVRRISTHFVMRENNFLQLKLFEMVSEKQEEVRPFRIIAVAQNCFPVELTNIIHMHRDFFFDIVQHSVPFVVLIDFCGLHRFVIFSHFSLSPFLILFN